MKSFYSTKDLKKSEIPLVEHVGSKAYNLFRLKELGFAVPDFFAISTDCVSLLKGDKELRSCYNDIFARKRELGSEYVAVRSSSLCEDGLEDSWAGHFTTHLSVSNEELLDAIIDCAHSCEKNEIGFYKKRKNITSDNPEKIGIIVQEMVYPNISGVLFTKHPITDDASVIYIETCSGLCDKLVSGNITPDTLLTSKDGVVIQKEGLLLSNQNTFELVKIALEIEKLFGFCCDIEWAIENTTIRILQVRPITTS